MSRRMRILRSTLLLAGASIVVLVGGAALAARPLPLYDALRLLPFLLLVCLAIATTLSFVVPSRGLAGRDDESLHPTLVDMSFDDARREADSALVRVGVQRRFDKSPDDMAALSMAHPTLVQFAHDWGSLVARDLDLEIGLTLAAERLRAAERPREGEARVPIGAWADRLLLADLSDGSIALVGKGAGPHLVTPTLHHAIVFLHRANANALQSRTRS